MRLAGLAIVIAAIFLPVLLIRLRKRWVAKFNLAVTNRITSRFAAHLPAFGILSHTGRKSGRVYRTPVNVFGAPGAFLIALTYGQEAHWAQNVLAAGGCELQTRGVQYHLAAPLVVHDPSRRQFPFPVRIILRVIGATDFMRLSVVSASQASSRQETG